jgi:choline dehydrogenase
LIRVLKSSALTGATRPATLAAVGDAYDYVIVGGGSAGAVVAARLAEDPSVSVCLLEAGPTDEGDDRVLELRRWLEVGASELTQTIPVEVSAGLGGLAYSRAYVLGGCGSHNQAIAFRAPTADLEAWEAGGAVGWGPAGTRSYFERVLARVGVEPAPSENACAAAFVEAGREAGLPQATFEQPDFTEGVGWLRLSARAGRRQSASIAYLHPLEGSPANLRLRCETRAVRLLFDGDRAVAVETTRGVVPARREVVVCAGAIETPKLLMLSGVGPARALRSLGIEVVADVAGVGEHLVDHPEATLIWEAKEPVPTGVMTDWEAGAFVRTRPGLTWADVQMHFGTMPVGDWVANRYGISVLPHALWLTPSVSRPKSTGRLWLRSAAPEEPPAIDPGYYSDPGGEDAAAIVAGLRAARSIAAQPALRRWIRREAFPGDGVESEDELLAHARSHATTVDHPAGTCRMGGRDDPLAVVDPALRLRGVRGVRIADASVFPTMIGVNINLTCMMIGEKAADLIRHG